LGHAKLCGIEETVRHSNPVADLAKALDKLIEQAVVASRRHSNNVLEDKCARS
jgi:hypothetical protein